MLRNMLLRWLGLEGARETIALANSALASLEGAFQRLDAMASRIQKGEEALGLVQSYLGLKQGTGWENAARALKKSREGR